MADWTNQSTNSLLPGEPWTSAKALAAFENPKAIAEGAPGAPPILTAALKKPEAGTTALIMRLQESEESTNNSSYAPTQRQNRAAANAHVGVTCLVPGTITAYAEHRTQAVGSPVSMRICRNGVVLQEWETTSNDYVVRQLDIPVNIGDLVTFQQRAGNSTYQAQWRKLRIYSSTPNLAVA